MNCRNFLKAKPGCPPLKEYKQSMAKQASPLPGSVKRKLDKTAQKFWISYRLKLGPGQVIGKLPRPLAI